jgi:hypothetical protein
MAERLANLYTALVGFGIPEADVSPFIAELTSGSFGAKLRRKAFLKKYHETITIGLVAMSDHVRIEQTKGIFS